jgi:hypothetical protein
MVEIEVAEVWRGGVGGDCGHTSLYGHQITSNRGVHMQELTAGMRTSWIYKRSQDRRRNGGDRGG